MAQIDFAEDTIDFQEESVAIDFQPEGKSEKYLAMQAEQAALAQKDKGGTAMKVLEFAEGVLHKTAYPVPAIMNFPVHLTQALGGQAQEVSAIPFVSPEAAQKAVEFITPGGKASEGTLGQAAQEFAAEMLSGMTSPEMVGTLAVTPASPAAVARYFQGQMLSQVPASVEAAIEAEPGKEKTKAILATAANVILPAMIEKGLTPAAPKTVLEARAAEVGPATEAVVKGKGVTESPLEPSVPLATAASESVKPAGVELPASAERPLPTISTETPATQPMARQQAPIPERFETVNDLLKFREIRRQEEIALYRDEIGLTPEEATRLQSLMARDASTEKFEKTIGSEKATRLNKFFDESPYNKVDGPFEFWEFDKRYDPAELVGETDKNWVATQLIQSLQSVPEQKIASDHFMFSAIASRRLKELGGTQSDLARALDSYTTRNAGSAGDKAELFKIMAERTGDFMRSQGVELPVGELGQKGFGPAVQPAMAERVTELRAPDKTGLATEPPTELMAVESKPELVGMGAATPAEYAQTPQTATGIKNRTVDLERAKRDLPPAMESGRQSFGEAWERAMGRMDKDSTYQERLISELGDKPRAVTDIEDAVLLHRQVDLQNEYGKATRDLAQAFDDGRMEDVAAEQVRVSGLSDQLHELYTINQAVGTETGRGLAARKMMAYEDFSLAKMEVERRAAKGGEQLTPEERAEVVTLQKKIETTQKAYDAYVAKTQQQISALEVKAALQAATQKAQADVPPKVLEIAKRIVNNLHREADAARARLRSQGVKFGSGPLHELPNIRDYAIIGADHLVTTGVKFAEWSGKMVKEFGEGIKPHLQAIFEESQKTLNTIDKNSAFVQPVKRAKAKPTVEEAKLHFENAKAKKEWHEKLQAERHSRLPALKKGFGMAVEVLNTTRAIMTSFDLSAVLRQGGFITLAHPIRAAKSFMPMLRAFRSEAKAHEVNLEIVSRPNYPLYQQAKLYLSEHGHALSKMEEAFMSRWIEKIPKALGGGIIRGSQRAYTTFLNKLRADSFDAMEATLSRTGKATPEEAAAIANFVNVATGRGRIGFKENAAVGLNTVFFAPRYVASRFQLLAGSPMWGGTLKTRTAIAKEYARYLMGLGVIYGLGQLAGAEVETDSRSSDFGKLRFGNTRIDPLSGLQQVAVLESRFFSGETKTLKGKIAPARESLVQDFLRNKLAPVPGAVWDARDIAVGKEPPPGHAQTFGELALTPAPIAFRDIYEALREQGVPEGTAMGLLSILGMGLQTYEPRK